MTELLSVQQVAQMTGLHEMTIRRYVRLGHLDAVRI
jgi:excisionase family DNA binding protein